MTTKIKLYIEQSNMLRHIGQAKRGLFDFFRSFYKILFGTLSASDADYYNNGIDKLYNHTNNFAAILSNQTEILKNTIDYFTKNIDSWQENQVTLLNWSTGVTDEWYRERANNLLLISLEEIEVSMIEADQQIADIIN